MFTVSQKPSESGLPGMRFSSFPDAKIEGVGPVFQRYE